MESLLATSKLSDPALRQRVRTALDQLRTELLGERTPQGHWVGELSPSALSTATAVSAISACLLYAPEVAGVGAPDEKRASELRWLVRRGMSSLRGGQNVDGGYGDTDRSHSNIATSYLVLAAAKLAEKTLGPTESLDDTQQARLQAYLDQAGGIEGLRKRYGADKTFVVPILTNMAIAGLVDWSQVAALPFEAAVFPQSMYRWLRMPVVSYAIPALVAIGQARHFLGPRAWFPLRVIRAASIRRTMNVLLRMQPESGGYLEATPLTSFVVMSLAVSGRGDCEVVRRGLAFLEASITDANSWPIDTNLATWVTSLSMHALSNDPDDDGHWCRDSLVDWHLNCQHRTRHPFTGAEPGGWGWTDLSGAVPDSDDTPAAIIALAAARRWVGPALQQRIDAASAQGIEWLRKLQNRNGGWPTFCRGWGKLPFDRSSTDLTAHALRAIATVKERSNEGSPGNLDAARKFLARTQRDDGAWLPLWFGNQDLADESNPVYGTGRVLLAGTAAKIDAGSIQRGIDYLIANQNADGGWGGGPSVQPWLERSPPGDASAVGERVGSLTNRTSSVEETAIALEALAEVMIEQQKLSASCGVPKTNETVEAPIAANRGIGPVPGDQERGDRCENRLGGGISSCGVNEACVAAIIRSVEFLLQSVQAGHHRVPWPIGFYFAKLWYHERLYPLIFGVAALGKFLQASAGDAPAIDRDSSNADFD